jgi:tight adherence protein C
VIVPILLGALAGGGALLSVRLLFPPAPPLQAAVDRLHRRNALASLTTPDQSEGMNDLLGRTVGASLARLARELGLNMSSLEADLRLTGGSIEQHMAKKIVLGLYGFALPAVLSWLAALLGYGVHILVPALFSLLLGLTFFFAPDVGVRHQARERRDAFKQSLGSFLDLVVISLAGGAGVESALRDAASIGRGWSYVQLHNALETTVLTGETPWAVLSRLGVELSVPELTELAASLSLAGTEGARVRESLAVKATSLRDHALAEAEADAQSTTEKMAVPVVMLFLGFLLLIGYPAASAIMSTI